MIKINEKQKSLITNTNINQLGLYDSCDYIIFNPFIIIEKSDFKSKYGYLSKMNLIESKETNIEFVIEKNIIKDKKHLYKFWGTN